jgi:mannosidase alpha-like ER degradation enhancer 2
MNFTKIIKTLANCAILATWLNASTSVAHSALARPSIAQQGKVEGMSELEARSMARQVKRETQHAWKAYKDYAWGHDAVKPLSATPHDWYGSSLLMTPVDALDTLLIMGLKKEAKEAQELIAKKLNFDQDLDVQNFEITIRLLGGLLSAYQLTDDVRLLHLAQDLGRRLLPVFNSPTGLPYTHVNLKTGKVKGVVSNPAETGTLLLEFGMLSKMTGDPIYYEKAKKALVATFQHASKLGLVGSGINVETGVWTDTTAHIRGGIDSYYEYLYKCYRLFGDTDCKAMWDTSIAGLNQYVAEQVRGQLWYGQVDMHTGKRTGSNYGALDAFMPALLVLGGDLKRAQQLQDSGMAMWRLHGIEPETIDYQSMQVRDGTYALRPEIIESAYYLHHATGDSKYRAMGKEMFADFMRHCKHKNGYAALKDVRTKVKEDSMESFVFAETFKYFYLLFAPKSALDFDQVTFNTEAHPLRLVPTKK